MKNSVRCSAVLPTLVGVLVQNFPDKLIEIFPRLLVRWGRLDLTVFTFKVRQQFPENEMFYCQSSQDFMNDGANFFLGTFPDKEYQEKNPVVLVVYFLTLILTTTPGLSPLLGILVTSSHLEVTQHVNIRILLRTCRSD